MGTSSLQSHLPSVYTSKLDSSKPLIFFSNSSHGRPQLFSLSKNTNRTRIVCSSAKDASNSMPPRDNTPSNFCIIEGPETVRDFVQMQLQEIQDNIRSRRNKIFLLMEEVRRLRVQQRIKNVEFIDESGEEENEMPDIPSSIPFLPHVTPKTLKQLYLTSFSIISGIIVFGGLLAPIVV